MLTEEGPPTTLWVSNVLLNSQMYFSTTDVLWGLDALFTHEQMMIDADERNFNRSRAGEHFWLCPSRGQCLIFADRREQFWRWRWRYGMLQTRQTFWRSSLPVTSTEITLRKCLQPSLACNFSPKHNIMYRGPKRNLIILAFLWFVRPFQQTPAESI